MKTENYITITDHNCHTTFGGTIYRGDFDTHSSMRDIASRIISDFKFDEYCRQRAARAVRLSSGQHGTASIHSNQPSREVK